MTVTVRFAPSPTGRIHVGNVRTALINWLYAKSQGGRFMLRLDDTDVERSRQEFADGIVEDLAWLGLNHDLTAKQSDRSAEYNAAAEKFKADGLLYPCYETPTELDLKRKTQRARGKPPVYDRTALSLSPEERRALEAEGRKPHWRFKLSGARIEWEDLVRGASHIETASVSDPVLIREDGLFLYTLPSVVDDIDFAITHVIRGEDHVTNTAVQIEIARALGAEPPDFGHHSLLVGAGGEGLSKRLGSLSIQSLREEGLEPLAIDSMLAKLGTSDPVEPRLSLDDLVQEFSFSKLSRSPAHFDVEELRSLNAKLLHTLPFEAVADRLGAMKVGGGAEFWEAVRGNLKSLGEATEWWQVVSEPLAPVIEDEAFVGQAAKLLPEGPFDEETWKRWTNALKSETGAKGKALFLPLRLALTGRAYGPEMRKLLYLMGAERAAARLKGQTA